MVETKTTFVFHYSQAFQKGLPCYILIIRILIKLNDVEKS